MNGYRNAAQQFNPNRSVEQTDFLPGREGQMIRNAGGGTSFADAKYEDIRKYMIMGMYGTMYYEGAKDIDTRVINSVKEAVKAGDHEIVLKMAVDVIVNREAFRRPPVIYVVCAIVSLGDENQRRRAYETIVKISVEPTDFFIANNLLDTMGVKWNSMRRGFVTKYYNQFNAPKLAKNVAKYQSRNGFSHRKALILGHPVPYSGTVSHIFKFAVSGMEGSGLDATRSETKILFGLEAAKAAKTSRDIVNAIREYGLTMEMVPTIWLKDPSVLIELLPNLGLTAVIRNLPRFQAYVNTRTCTNEIIARISDENALSNQKVHPLRVFLARQFYGLGENKNLKWQPDKHLSEALEDTMLKCYNYLPAVKNRVVIAIDRSGSMGGASAVHQSLTSIEASKPLLYAIGKCFPNAEYVEFSSKCNPLQLTSRSSYSEFVREIHTHGAYDTNASSVIEHARYLTRKEKEYPVDGIIMVTDGMFNSGTHMSSAIREYAKEFGKPVKSGCAIISAYSGTPSDPGDPNQLTTIGYGPGITSMFQLLISGKTSAPDSEDE